MRAGAAYMLGISVIVTFLHCTEWIEKAYFEEEEGNFLKQRTVISQDPEPFADLECQFQYIKSPLNGITHHRRSAYQNEQILRILSQLYTSIN